MSLKIAENYSFLVIFFEQLHIMLYYIKYQKCFRVKFLIFSYLVKTYTLNLPLCRQYQCFVYAISLVLSHNLSILGTLMWSLLVLLNHGLTSLCANKFPNDNIPYDYYLNHKTCSWKLLITKIHYMQYHAATGHFHFNLINDSLIIITIKVQLHQKKYNS